MGAPHPRMHGVSHLPGGPDPIPGLGDPGGSSGGFTPYAVATCTSYVSVAAGVDTYIDFATVRASGIIVGSDRFTIITPGDYEITAAGFSEVIGAAAAGSYCGVRLEIAGTVEAHYVEARTPAAVAAGAVWNAPLTLLRGRQLATSNTVRLDVYSSVAAAFVRFTLSVRALG